MFKILDGREAFYQWDSDRKIEIKDKSITQVHFANFMSQKAIVMDAYSLNGKWVVDVPNTLLEKNLAINVYGFDANYTKYEKVFTVNARQIPDDYVYSNEDYAKWEDLEERLDKIEAEGFDEEVIKEAVNNYLEQNPVEVPVESVNGKTGAVVLTAEDVDALPADTVIPSIEGLATEKYVDDAITAIELTPGPVGPTGEPGPKGNDGYTPIKGVDYFDGKDGLNGKDGKDGIDGKDYVLTEEDKAEIAGMVEVSGGDVDLSDYYTKEEIDNLLSNLPTGDIPSGEEVKW